MFTLSLLLLTCQDLLAQPQLEVEFLSTFGQRGTAPGEFHGIAGVTVDNLGYIYITDNQNHRIQVCDYQGNCEPDGSRGSAPGQFTFSIGIALDSTGRIVVSDGQGNRIQIRDLNGQWSTFGSAGQAVGQFRIPGGLTVDAADRIIIADENNELIQICSDQGVCSAFGGGFVTPRAVALDSQGRIIVSDSGTNRVSSCTYNGTCSSWGSEGTAPGQFRAPKEVFVDAQDRLFIADRDNHRIQVCDLAGACTAFGQEGTGPGQFRSPTAITVDNQDRIIVGDYDNDRIQIFQATYPPPPEPERYTIGGTVSGLAGSGLVLQNNGGDDLPIAADGGFTFATDWPDGASYAVSVLSQPTGPAQTCTVNNGSGTLAGADVTDVAVNCLTDAQFRINVGLNDAWFNPATDGQGFFIIVFPDISVMFLAWFTYDTERPPDDVGAVLGEPGHRWITAQGPFEGNTATLDVAVSRGGVFNAGEPVPENSIEGSMEVVFDSCTSGTAEYDLPALGLMGAVPMQRITNDKVALCEAMGLE